MLRRELVVHAATLFLLKLLKPSLSLKAANYTSVLVVKLVFARHWDVAREDHVAPSPLELGNKLALCGKFGLDASGWLGCLSLLNPHHCHGTRNNVYF